MKECELCDSPARMYCESDEASLCWDCDLKIHSANFLVARHTRTLLCHSCQSPTPWKASGSKLGRNISICESCVNRCNGEEEGKDEHEENDDESRGPGEEDDETDDEGQTDESDDDDDEEEEEEEDDECQVVPWSSNPPPPISSSSEESCSRFCKNALGTAGTSTSLLNLKRIRDQNSDLSSQDDLGYNQYLGASMVNRVTDNEEEGEGDSFVSFRPLKDRKLALKIQTSSTHADSSSTIINSLKRFEGRILAGNNSSETIQSICKLSKDPKAS